jgi:acyl carrier protein phosphodiesterase
VNFLAHLQLAAPESEMMMGGFIADGTKTNQLSELPAGWARGVHLHWEIDRFTDAHPKIADAIGIFREQQQKYAGVVVDIVMDHFLAANWSRFSTKELAFFAKEFYDLANANNRFLQKKHQRLLHYMQRDNWLVGYGELSGLQQAMSGISQRAAFNNNMHLAVDTVRINYDALNELFLSFYRELSDFVANWKHQNP